MNKSPASPLATESATFDTKHNEEDGKDNECFCICRGVDDGTLMVQCEQCELWFHAKCVGLSSAEVEQMEKYFCVSCCPPKSKPKSKCFNPTCTNPSVEGSKYCGRRCGLSVARRRLNFLNNRKTTASEHIERLSSAERDDRLELEQLERDKKLCQEAISRLAELEEERLRILQTAGEQDLCGFPGCELSRTKCFPHRGWPEIRRDEILLARTEDQKALEKIEQRQQFLYLRIERRTSLAAILFHQTVQH